MTTPQPHPPPQALRSAQPPSNLALPVNLIQIIEDPAKECPEETAVRLCHHGGPSETITWGQLWNSAWSVADRLCEMDLPRGGRVMMVLPTSRSFIETFFGILLAGGIPVTAAPPPSLRGPSLPPHKELLKSIASDSGACLCVSQPQVQEVLEGSLLAANPEIRFLPSDAPQRRVAAFRVSHPDPADSALIQYTSGSTSRPKGVELSHRNILANVAGIAKLVDSKEGVGFSWLPLHHDMGLIGTLLTALYARRPMVLMPPQAFIKDPALWLRGISDFRVTVTVAPNFAFDYCVKNIDLKAVAHVRLDSLKVALNGAEPINVEAVEQFEEKFRPLGLQPGTVCPVYGLAESSLAVTFSDPGRLLVQELDADELERHGKSCPGASGARLRKVISVGRPIAGLEVRVVDDHDQPLEEGYVGEIVVKGTSVMKGYYNQPAETGRALRGGWLHTGDLGYLARGHLFVTGRHKDIIIRHGRNYYPQDIEEHVGRIEGVSKDRTIAFAVESSGSTSVVVVTEIRFRNSEALAEAKRKIQEQVHNAFLFGPDDIRLVRPGTIPRTTSGKVRRQECKRLYLSGALDPVEMQVP